MPTTKLFRSPGGNATTHSVNSPRSAAETNSQRGNRNVGGSLHKSEKRPFP